jgi:replicative DNA helicase
MTQPPHDIDAERACLGGMLLNPDAALRVVEVLGNDPKRFYRPDHQAIYAAMLSLLQQSRPLDPMLIAAAITDEKVGISYLAELTGAVPTSANSSLYAAEILDKWRHRRIIESSERAAQNAYRQSQNWRDIAGTLQSDIFGVLSGHGTDTTAHVSALTPDAMERIKQQGEGTGVHGISTGFRDLDSKTSGFQPADMIVLAARPSVGKTAFALNIGLNIARAGKPVLFFSLEMAKQTLVMRLLCAQGGVDSSRIATGFLARQEYPKLAAAQRELDKLPFYINDQVGITMMEMRAKALRLSSEFGQLGIIVIDYLQLVSPTRRSDSRQVEVAETSKEIKQLARDTNAPVLALSQLSRAPEKREDSTVRLSDIRDSGQIEADADVVIFLSRSPNKAESDVIDATIAKQRNGPTGNFRLVFLRDLQQFRALGAPRVEPPEPAPAYTPYRDDLYGDDDEEPF